MTAMSDIAELNRRLANVVRIGTVEDIHVSDHAAPRVRVRDGDITTGWLPFATMRAGSARVWSVPSVGEQVVMIAPSGQISNAIVIGSLFCVDAHAPSSSPDDHIIDLPDGTRITHNSVTGAISITGARTVTIQSSESVTIDAPRTYINGLVEHQGDGLNSNGVQLHTHAHGGVLPGGADTAGPK